MEKQISLRLSGRQALHPAAAEQVRRVPLLFLVALCPGPLQAASSAAGGLS